MTPRTTSARPIKASFLAGKSAPALGIALTAICLSIILLFSRHWGHYGHSTATPLTKNEARPGWKFVPGDRWIYRFRYAGNAELDFGALFAAPNPTSRQRTQSLMTQSFKVDLRANLVLTVVDKRVEDALIACKLQEQTLRITIDGRDSAALQDQARKDLSGDFHASVSYDGRVRSVRFDPAVSKVSRSVARTVLASIQFVFPVGGASDLGGWETQEDDPNGHYVARYVAETDAGRARAGAGSGLKRFRKIKVKYLPARDKINEAGPPMTIAPKGSSIASFDIEAGRLVSLEGTESQTLSIGGRRIGRTESSLLLDFLRKETVAGAELLALRDTAAKLERLVEATPLSAKASPEEGRAARQRVELGGATLESLLVDLAGAESKIDPSFDEGPLSLKFEALIYLHPETSEKLGEELIKAVPESRTMRILTSALSAAGNPEAQAALVNAIRARSGDWPSLSQLIPALGSVKRPTQLAEDTLRDLSSNASDQNVASTSRLALGNMARSLAEGSPARAAEIVQWAIKNLESSPAPEMTRQWLLALGNAGSELAFPIIARFASDASPDIRAVAVSALRWIGSSRAEELLIRTLTSDSEPGARLEAVIAMGIREMSDAAFKAQKEAFKNDKSVEVRLALLRNLWQASEAFPEIRQLVRAAARNDASKDVRKAAAEIIARYGKEYSERK